MQNRLSKVALCLLILPAVSALAPTQTNTINGPSAVQAGTTQEYTLCPPVYPYVWKWKVSGDAKVAGESTTGTCYKCQVQFGKQPATITFEQSNPAGVPPVFNLTKTVTIKK